MTEINQEPEDHPDDQNFGEFINQRNTNSTEVQDEFDEPDETIFERIAALKDIFPENFIDNVGSFISTAYDIACDASWIFFSSTLILLGPIIFEHERMRLNENLNENEEQNSVE